MHWNRRTLIGAACLLLAGSICYWAGRMLWASHEFNLAMLAADRFEFDLAHEHILAAHRLRGDDPAILAQCVRLGRKSGNYLQAESQLQELRKFPTHTREAAWEELLLLAQQGKMSPEDEQRLLVYSSTAPDYRVEAVEALIQGFLRNYRLGEAQTLAKELLTTSSDHAPGYYLLGLVHEGLSRVPDAIVSYQKAVNLQPMYFAARLRLAECYLAQNNPTKAKEEFERLNTQRPEHFVPRFGLGRCYGLLGQSEQAERVFKELTPQYPNEVALWQELGKLALNASRSAQAEEYYRRANELDPFDPPGVYGMAQSLRQLGRSDEASKWLKKHRELEMDLNELQSLHHQVGQAPASAEKRRQAAVICFRNGQEKEALRWLAGALQLDPNDRDCHLLLADYHERKGQTASAEEHRKLANAGVNR